MPWRSSVARQECTLDLSPLKVVSAPHVLTDPRPIVWFVSAVLVFRVGIEGLGGEATWVPAVLPVPTLALWWQID